jgi:hypothetical protein
LSTLTNAPISISVEKGACRVKFKVCALFHEFLLLDYHVNGLAGIGSIVFYQILFGELRFPCARPFILRKD